LLHFPAPVATTYVAQPLFLIASLCQGEAAARPRAAGEGPISEFWFFGNAQNVSAKYETILSPAVTHPRHAAAAKLKGL